MKRNLPFQDRAHAVCLFAGKTLKCTHFHGHIRNFGRLEALGFDHAAARIYMRMKRTNQFVFMIFGEKLQLELQEDHKYWHVGEVECC